MTLGRPYRHALARSLRGRGVRTTAALVMLTGTCMSVAGAAGAAAAAAGPAGHVHAKASPD